jgi:minor histocompatibility antigen H13
MAPNPYLNLSYLALFALWAASYFVAIPVPVNLILQATLIVYIGSYRSLNLLVKEADGGAKAQETEVLSMNDAYKFPLVGSAALFGLYVAFKYCDKDTVNLILSLYFSVVGVFALTGSFSSFASLYITSKTQYGFKKTFPLVGEIDMLCTPAEIVCLIISTIFSVVYFKTKHYMMNNIFGICFCIQSIERISVGSYKIGAILLVGLFFYDIFWVFGTDVMVTVAKSFDGPIKLLFPVILPTLTEKGKFSLLGLGDIVIPGLFVALLLRFDAVRAKLALVQGLDRSTFASPYFLTNVGCYALGLLCTVGVMYFFNAAQPALLYLVPACLGGSLAVGTARGELAALFAYEEEGADKKKAEAEKAEAEKKSVEGAKKAD